MSVTNTPPNTPKKKPYFPPPPPLNTPPKGLWRATPPRSSRPCWALWGSVWHGVRRGFVLGAPVFIGEMVLGAVVLLYLFGLVAYLAKAVRRPSVVAEDVKILPGRAGLSAGSATGMLMASALIPFAPALAKGVLMTFFILHAIVAVLIIRSFLLGPAEQRRVTPVWHLSFVGFIIGAVPALGLGWTGLASAIFYTTLPIAAAIWLVSALPIGACGCAGTPASASGDTSRAGRALCHRICGSWV